MGVDRPCHERRGMIYFGDRDVVSKLAACGFLRVHQVKGYDALREGCCEGLECDKLLSLGFDVAIDPEMTRGETLLIERRFARCRDTDEYDHFHVPGTHKLSLLKKH